MDGLTIIYVGSLCLLLVYIPKGYVSGGDAGAILSAAILQTFMFQYAIRVTTEFENQMVSAERLFEYGRLESEAELTIPDKVIDNLWPSKEALEFHSLSAKYSPSLPFVLKDVSFTIKPGQHVGVV